jgi:HlyD family secretion protein
MRRSLIGLAILVAVSAIGYFLLAERPLAVPVVSAEKNVPVRVYGLGTLEARILSKVGFEVGAALTSVTADSGNSVTEGQVLARLHSAEQEARVARAEAAVDAAGATLGKTEASIVRARAVLAQQEAANARQQALVGRSTISKQSAEEAQRDVDVAAAELAVAESEVEIARAQIADAEAGLRYETALLEIRILRAPFDAVVVARHVELGTVVRAGEPVFTLMDPATVWTLAYIDEASAGTVALGQSAEVRLRSLPHEVFHGTVARIGIESDRVNEERRVWIACDRCPSQPHLGEQAEVTITVATLAAALLVPEVAVSAFDGHQGRVWVVQDGRLQEVELVFGHRTEDARLEIVSGLPHDAQVVAVAVRGISEGRRARVIGEGAP